MTACEFVTNDKTVAAQRTEGWYVRTGGGYKVDGRYESDLTAVDPVTLEIKKSLSAIKKDGESGRAAGEQNSTDHCQNWNPSLSKPGLTP